MKTISLLIPIHNRLDITKKGLQSLYNAIACYTASLQEHRQFSFNVVVVNDGSTDGSAEWIAQHYPAIHLLHGDGNLWWSGAINKGAYFAIQQLKTDYVLLWNDDTICSEKYFVELDNVFNRYPPCRQAILASKVFWVDQPGVLFNFGCFFNAKTGTTKLIGYNRKDQGQYSDIVQIDWSGGMGTLIPAGAVVQLNYFDAKSFPQYHGDIDFFLRAKKAGYQAFAIGGLHILNNRESTGLTGLKRCTGLKQFRLLLKSYTSNYNLKQNYIFTLRHANTLLGWLNFTGKYVRLTVKSFKEMLWA